METTNIAGPELASSIEMERRKKFKFYGHTARRGGTARAVLESSMERRRERGRPQGNWLSNLKEWRGGIQGAKLSRMVKIWKGW